MWCERCLFTCLLWYPCLLPRATPMPLAAKGAFISPSNPLNDALRFCNYVSQIPYLLKFFGLGCSACAVLTPLLRPAPFAQALGEDVNAVSSSLTFLSGVLFWGNRGLRELYFPFALIQSIV